jgi:hypothetical protein
MSTPLVFPGSPNVRKSDPMESHMAADRAVTRRRTLRAVCITLQDAGEAMTAYQIWEIARLKGFQCTPERVRTVLAEGERDGIFQPIEGGTSQYGNPCRLWTLKEWNA